MLTNKDLKYRTLGFGTQVLCFYKEYNGGVYDVYICDKCIATSINKNEIELIVKTLKLEEI